MSLPLVAIIGQSNAGKSSVFNRLAGAKIAITAREAGTTRDNVVTKVNGIYTLIDTAGLKDPEDPFETQIQDQISDAISTADLILFVVDSSKYPDHKDKMIAKKALKSGKPVLLLLNKSDLKNSLACTEFLHFGIKPAQTVAISAGTGFGFKDLSELIYRTLASKGLISPLQLKQILAGSKPVSLAQDKNTLNIAFVGRPNVGKSSLFNALLKKQQAIVANLSGTTRDVNRQSLRFKGQDIVLFDTAGLRRPGKREVGIEKFSAARSLAAIASADVACLLIDATDPHAKLDQAIAGEIIKAGKGLIFVVTKSDLISSQASDTDALLDGLQRDFPFAFFAPVLVTSSKTGKNITKIFTLAREIATRRAAKFTTAKLNKILQDAVLSHAPSAVKGLRPTLKYVVQTDSNPPWFVVYGSNLGLLHFSYKRYLENCFRAAFDFTGTPICFSFKNN